MDRKTVMSWLEVLAADDWRMFYSDSEVSNTAKAALELLKEQEAMPIKDDKHWTQFKCPRCNAQLQRTTFFKMDTRFCKYCGQEVKFE